MVTQSGRQTLSSIDQGIGLVHDQIREIDEQIKTESDGLVELQEQQGERYKSLARIRLDHVISGELASGLDVAGQRVRELLQERSEAQTSLIRQIDDALAELAALQTTREDLNLKVERATDDLDEAEATVQERLAQDDEYLARLGSAQEAERVAEHAEEKTQRAEESRQSKGQPYQDDPLFSYLWSRKYGTSAYSANSLFRFLDKWVARLCNYQDARPNYAMLLEIPKRLREHAQRVRAAADVEFGKLKEFEESASEQDGVPALRQTMEQAQSDLDQADLEIEAVENRLRDMEQLRTGFASGEDEHIQKAVETLSSAFEREKLHRLYDYARATITAEDDLLVQELEAGADRAMAIKESMAEHKRVRERHLDRMRELENVRRRFKRQRFDNAHSEFGNSALIAMILSQFLRGTATSDELWQTIERAQRYRRRRSNPDFGSGGFGNRQGTWHFPFPRAGGIGRGGWGGSRGPGGLGRGGLGRGGLGGGGGFRTGGGF